MSKFNYLTNTFKAGEFSPKMIARTDVEEYKSSCEEILNMFPLKQGGVTKRQGTRARRNIATNSNPTGNDLVRNIPFIFSKDEAYVITIDTSGLEDVPAGNEVLNSTNLLSTPTGSNNLSLTLTDFLTITPNGGGIAGLQGDLGVVYDEQVAGVGQATVISNEIYFYDPYFKSQFNLIGADTSGFHYAQSGDVLVLTHNSGTIPPIVITREEELLFSVEWYHRFDLESFFGIPYTAKYYSSILRFPLRAPNTRDITIAGTYLETHRSVIALPTTTPFDKENGQLNLYDVYELRSNTGIFTEAKLGSTYVITLLDGVDLVTVDFTIVDVDYDNGNGGVSPFYCKAITSRYHSADHTVDLFGSNSGEPTTTAPASFASSDNWSEAAFSDEYGFPRSVCFFEQRLIFGGTLRDVDTIWGSRTGNILVMFSRKFEQDKGGEDVTNLNNFIPSNVPDKDKVVNIFGDVNLETDPVDFRPSSQEINAIQWLSSGQALMVGTLGAEYIVSGGNNALSATSISYRRQTSRGSSPIMPARIDDEVMYVIRDGRASYNFKFNESNGSYLSNELTLHADHIVDYGDGEEISQFRTLEYCASRNIVFAVTTDNKLIGFTYSPANAVMAWHRFDFSEDKVHSVTCVPSEDGNVDEIWVTVERGGIRSLESIPIDFMGESSISPTNPTRFLDNHNFYIDDGTQARQIFAGGSSGRGDMVVYLDGEYYAPYENNGGSGMTVPPFFTAIVGIPFEAHVITTDFNAGGEFGSSLGLTQRIDRIHALLYKSRNVAAGHPKGKIDQIKNLEDDLSTGNYPIDFAFGPAENGAKVKIMSKEAYPLTVLGVVARGQTYERA